VNRIVKHIKSINMNTDTNSEASSLSTTWRKLLASPGIAFSPARLRGLQLSINHFDRFAESQSLAPVLLTPVVLLKYKGYLRELGLTNNTIYRHVKNVKQLQALTSKIW
jgi:hypothetical protein